jgi:O-antigen ligase
MSRSSVSPSVEPPAAVNGRADLESPSGRLLFALFAAGVLGSSRLALANNLLALCLLGTLWDRRRRGWPLLRRSPLDVPLLAFAAGTVVAAIVSVEPATSFRDLKALFSFLLVPLTLARIGSRRMGEIVLDGLAGVGALLAIHGHFQFAMGMNNLESRIRGPLSHYMTFAGVLLLIDLVSIGRIALGPGTRRQRLAIGLAATAGAGLAALSVSPNLPTGSGIPLRLLVVTAFAAVLVLVRREGELRRSLLLGGAVALMTSAIALSFTRNAWIGLVAGVGVILLLSAPRAILALAPAAILAAFLLPRPVLDRIAGTFSIRETSNYDRLCMIEAGTAMIEDRPLFGLGPGAVKIRYPLYRRPDAPRFRVPHLHNNVIQIAAERGLFTLAAYLAILGTFFVQTGRALRRATSRDDLRALVAPIAAIVGITIAGLFEANFQDTEVLLPTLFLLALPFADGSVSENGGDGTA